MARVTVEDCLEWFLTALHWCLSPCRARDLIKDTHREHTKTEELFWLFGE